MSSALFSSFHLGLSSGIPRFNVSLYGTLQVLHFLQMVGKTLYEQKNHYEPLYYGGLAPNPAYPGGLPVPAAHYVPA